MDLSIKNSRELLDKYLDEILETNKTLNLTRVTDIEAARLLHLEDSLSILEDIEAAPEGTYLDIGSGGGFPGVPLGIMTERDTVLIDSVKKKMTAVGSILNDLQITHIKTVGERVEDYSKEHPGEFSVITARAVSSIAALLELASPLLKINGRLILMKSKEKDSFNEEAALEKLGMKLISFREYMLSDNETYRCVYIFEKVSEPTVPLPRRVGMAQKRPLVEK